jgi:SAM-dependent methyltransferase
VSRVIEERVAPELLALLCCPECRHELQQVDSALLCAACEARYPIRRGIPRFVRDDGYVRSFSFEWTRWSRVQLDGANGTTESEQTFVEKTGFTRPNLDGKVVLDGGCGAGRFLDVASRWNAKMAVGIDFSFAIDAAHDNLASRENVFLVQADLLKLPFRDGVFDAIFSIGVLHHTSDTRQAFLGLPRLLKQNGTIAVWLYHYTDRLYCAATDMWRSLFRRLPPVITLAWCWLLVATLSELYRTPLFQRSPWSTLRRVLPIDTHRSFAWRVLDTFDWYSPRYQDKQCSVPRTVGWFREAGLREIEALPIGTSVRGTKAPRERTHELRTPMLAADGRRLLIFGAGAGGREALLELDRLGLKTNVVGICDNDPAKWSAVVDGFAVRRFDDIPRDGYDAVIIASAGGALPIRRQLIDAGLSESTHFADITHVLAPFAEAA